MPKAAALFVMAAVSAAPPAALEKAGDAVEGRISSSSAAIHELHMEAGQFFFAQVNGIRMTLELLDPSGKGLWPAGRTAAAILTEPGTYRLKVRTFAPTVQRYILTVNHWRASRPNDTIRLEAIGVLSAGFHEAEQATVESRRRAIGLYRDARQQAASIQDTWLEARCLLSESIVQSALGQTEAALAALNEAIRIYRSRGDRGGEAYALNAAALLYAYRSEHARAFANYEQALAYWREKGDRGREAEVLRNMAIAHAAAGNLRAAVETYQEVLAHFRSANDRYNEAVTLVQLSDFYLNLGDHQQALAYARQALPLHRAHLDKTGEVHTLTNIGEALAGQGKHAAALDYFHRAMRIGRESGLGWLHVNTQALAGASHEALGAPERAGELYRQALGPMQAHGNRDGASRVLTRLGLLALRRGALDEAGQFLGEAHELAKDAAGGTAQAYARTGLARLAWRRGDGRAARQHTDAALALIEQSRVRVDDKNLRATFLASRAAAYDLAIDLLMEKQETAAAFAVLERFRARGLMDLLGNNNQASQAPAQPASLPGFPRRTALIAYHFGEERSWMFVVTQDGVVARPFPQASAIDGHVRRIRALLSQPARAAMGRYVQAAAGLFRICLEPAMPLLSGKQHLVIVPDGPLHYLPFEALLTATPPDLAYSRLPYLVERWNVTYAPSATAFLALQTKTPPARGPELVAFGDPKGDLPGAATELTVISKAFPTGRTLLFPGPQASKKAVLESAPLRRARLVHFATHGLLGEGSAASSGLLLANNAFLSSSEILRQKWNAELVVLSACETGLGPRLRGEGILGLTRAFLFAGVSSVAVSLWPVSDESTVTLMGDFYRRMSRGEPKSEALRQAKLALIRSGIFSHPYFWAPFVLSGQT